MRDSGAPRLGFFHSACRDPLHVWQWVPRHSALGVRA
jgi:hypothetical protein